MRTIFTYLTNYRNVFCLFKYFSCFSHSCKFGRIAGCMQSLTDYSQSLAEFQSLIGSLTFKVSMTFNF